MDLGSSTCYINKPNETLIWKICSAYQKKNYCPVRLSGSPTFSYFSYCLDIFLLFSLVFLRKLLLILLLLIFQLVAIKCQNNFSYREKLGLQESAPFILGHLGPKTPGLINSFRFFFGSFWLFHSFAALQN